MPRKTSFTRLVVLTSICVLVLTPYLVSPVRASIWWFVAGFHRNADVLEYTTENFTCNHADWRLRYKYFPWYGGSSFTIAVFNVGIDDPIATISDVRYQYVLQITDERYFSGNGTYFLQISASNIAYYYDVTIEQDVDSPGITPLTQLNTTVSIVLQPESTKMRASTTISASLHCVTWYQPIPNQIVEFYVGPTSIGSATTNDDGYAIKTYVASLDVGNYSVVAIYNGTLDFWACNASAVLAVTSLNTIITLQHLPIIIENESTTLNAALGDEFGGRIQGANIEFQYYDGFVWQSIGSASTNSYGTASIEYIFSDIGTFQLRTMFNGTENYSQSTSQTLFLTVNSAPDSTSFSETPIGRVVVIGGIIAVGAILGVAFIVRRRKQI